MAISEHLYGYGETGEAREAALRHLQAALQAVVTLDMALQNHPLLEAWLRLDREVALVAAVRDNGGPTADFGHVLAARLGAKMLPRGHVALGDLDTRAGHWNRVRQRKGSSDLRALVASLAPRRGTLDLVALADAVAAALARCVAPSWRLVHDADNAPMIVVDHRRAAGDTDGAAGDAADLALAVPYALRRLGLTRGVLPSLSGRVRVFGHDDEQPLAPLTLWAETLARQAGEGAARLRRLERYAAGVALKLETVRRPEALRRLAGVGLSSWSLWAARLAERTGVQVSSAWRSLEQARDLGVVAVVPTERRSRGDGTLYAIPPWLQLAGLVSARPGRPATVSIQTSERHDNRAGVAAAMAEADAAMAAIDALLGSNAVRQGASHAADAD